MSSENGNMKKARSLLHIICYKVTAVVPACRRVNKTRIKKRLNENERPNNFTGSCKVYTYRRGKGVRTYILAVGTVIIV